uniref:Uncharacterized protein n=1 Tax=Oryza meridionalis TaxID=40149 RepID=A0A0E0D1T0_9ORYZ
MVRDGGRRRRRRATPAKELAALALSQALGDKLAVLVDYCTSGLVEALGVWAVVWRRGGGGGGRRRRGDNPSDRRQELTPASAWKGNESGGRVEEQRQRPHGLATATDAGRRVDGRREPTPAGTRMGDGSRLQRACGRATKAAAERGSSGDDRAAKRSHPKGPNSQSVIKSL